MRGLFFTHVFIVSKTYKIGQNDFDANFLPNSREKMMFYVSMQTIF